VERLQNLVGDQPKEDEFGLPVIELPGDDKESDPTESLIAEFDEDKLEKVDALTEDALPGELPELEDEKEPGKPAEPRAAPMTPVEALPAARRSPRYQSTMDRLRRLNEAVSREVRVDPQAILSEGRRARRAAEETMAAPSTGPRTMPPSPVERPKLMQRQTSSTRMVDRLERIRRDIYATEEEAAAAEAAEAAARELARRKAELARLTQREEAATPLEGEESTVGVLAKFFRSENRREAEKPGIPQDYRKGHDQGRPEAAVKDEAPMKIAEAAVKPDTDEPKPGQKPGSMAPGFLENLSQLFTDQKKVEAGWAADVEVNDPATGTPPGGGAPVMKPVAGAGTGPAPAATLTLPAGATGNAWTTTVEMNTETGDPMVLQVTKSPVPSAPEGPQPDAAPPARATELADLPKPSAATAPDDDLPAIDESPVKLPDEDLPPAEGEAQEGPDDDLPPAEGETVEGPDDDLPPAEGEEPEAETKAAQKPARKPRKPLPYSDPLRAPDPIPQRDRPAVPARTLPRLAEQKPGPEDPASGRGNLRLTPDETLAVGARKRYPTQGEVAAKQQGRSQLWPVTKLAKNDVTPVPRARPAMLSRTSLTGATFALGESVSLESSLPPEDGVDGTNQCVKKNRGTTLFCIEPVDWPEDLRAKFVVPTILYTGPMAIVRYDQGSASRLHALFPSAEFQTIAEYYQKRYGDPTEIWKRSIAPLAEPRRDNPTIAWRSRDPKTNAVTILEIRQYDDTRGGFPDTGRGAVMLYLANSPAIFPQVSSHELMRLKRDKDKQPG